ncbi:MAG: hypothetical protein HY841_03430 [Bacteroidetes bacterium]|nr:hypothetical protein [Bacteroidota bacterium]
MNKGFDVLDKLGVKYSLGRGLILGFHRDGKFLPNDIDIDIDIFGDKQVYEIIKNMPFEMLLLSSCNGRYMQLAFLDRETNVIFDILFYYTEGNRVVNRNVYGYFWMPVEKIKNMSAITINNKSYPSLDPEWFCNFWYGEDWKKPQKYNADWTIDYRRNCKGFIYKGIDNVVFR